MIKCVPKKSKKALSEKKFKNTFSNPFYWKQVFIWSQMVRFKCLLYFTLINQILIDIFVKQLTQEVGTFDHH